jgi:WhiB family redox-sensing transcriptional regulator
MAVVSLNWTADDYAAMGEAPDGDPALRYEGPSSLADLIERPAWMADALCREHPEVNFFPERGDSSKPAQAVCARCAVCEACLTFALADGGERFGVFGGLSGRQRRLLRQGRSAAA